MNRNDILSLFHSPYGSWGLRYRASKLEDCPYRNLLRLLANMRDSKKLSRSETISIIKDFRAGRLDDGIAKLHSHGLTVQFLRERLVGRYAKKEPEKEVPKEPRVEKY